MKETIKIAFIDFWPEWDIENFITPILEKYYNVIIDQDNPDVLFHSLFDSMRGQAKYKCKKVLIIFENWRSNIFKSDYSISFDPPSDKNFRLPLWQIYWMLNPEIKDRLFNRVQHNSFDNFCAFTVTNPSNGSRNLAFDQLNEYKEIKSYGKVRTNDLSLIKYTKGKYWRDAKDQFFQENTHKFMITYENNPWPGYCTEKIMDGFLAGSVPIYWGDPIINEDWNSKAFINAQKLGFGWIDFVKEVDNNQDLFNSIYSEPIFTDSQKERHLENLNNFEIWLIDKVKK